MNWIVLFAQQQPISDPDTIRCYGITDLRKIAVIITECQACDSLLYNANNKISNRNQVIGEKEVQIDNLNKQILYKDTLISNRESDIKSLKSDVERLENLNNIFKKGWIATGGILSLIILVLLL